MSLQQIVAVFLALVIGWPLQGRSHRTVQDSMLKIPAGSVISVKLQNRQTLRGRLGEIRQDSFELQTLEQGSISGQTVRYSDVHSVRYQKAGMKTSTKIAVGVLAGIGVFAIVMVIWIKVSGPFVL
jgi:hypothetical protein